WQLPQALGRHRACRFAPPALPVCTPHTISDAPRRFLLRCMSARRSFQRRWLDRCSSGASVPRLKLRHPAQPRQSRRWPRPPTANCVNAAALGGGLVSIVLWWVGGVLVTRVRLLQLPCLCTPPACQQRLVATLAWATAVGRFRCRGRRSCGWRPLLRLGRCGAVRRGGVPFRPGWVRVPRYLVRCGLAGRRSPRATRVGDH
ncbi:transmembrane protein, partial [Mycobacterium tuberculosis MAL010088]